LLQAAFGPQTTLEQALSHVNEPSSQVTGEAGDLPAMHIMNGLPEKPC